MIKDIKLFLWVLKLGSIVNIYFFINTLTHPLNTIDLNLLIPAKIMFLVSMFRCLFPVRYPQNIVFHDIVFSSIFLTRLFATFSEIGMIYLFAYIIQLLNVNKVLWINIASFFIIVQVVASQFFVWGAIVLKNFKLYFYEEVGWFNIYLINTIVSIYFYITIDNFYEKELLVYLNLLFGIVYLPWQLFHLKALLLLSNFNAIS